MNTLQRVVILMMLFVFSGCGASSDPVNGQIKLTFEVRDAEVAPGQVVQFEVSVVNNTDTEVSFYYTLYIDDSPFPWKHFGPFEYAPGGEFKDSFSLTPDESKVGSTTFTVKIETDFPVDPSSKEKTIQITVLPVNRTSG